MSSSTDSSFAPTPNSSAATSTMSTEESVMSTNPAQGAEKPPDDTSKLKMFLGILRKFIGVADIASVRFSLPAQLLEPTPNLEYWNYLDRPEMFVAIGDSDEPLERMLEVLRFWFTKDLKYVKGKPCKPYNSALGEFFRCNWDVTEPAPPMPTLTRPPTSTTSASAASSIRSLKFTTAQQTPTTSTTHLPATSPSKKLEQPIRISYLTEQTSHHPPVSAFYVSCPAKGLTARGFDQLSAKFTGTSIKVTPGPHNLGIFITLHRRKDKSGNEETYRLTHPAAHLGGLLRGALSVSVGDSCFVTCRETGIRTILTYKEDGWLSGGKNRVDGVMYRFDASEEDGEKYTRIQDVPDGAVLGRIQGNWKEKIWISMGKDPRPAEKELILLLDLSPPDFVVQPKIIPPMESQLPNESLRFWARVTEAIHARRYGEATLIKQEIEEVQREKARRREEVGEGWKPRFFSGGFDGQGRPELSEEGKKVLEGAQRGQWKLEARSP